MSEKALISFCIPTYSRPHEACECVKNIIKYCDEPIEIVITDNSMDKRTRDIMTVINDPRIKYFHNKENIGRSNNVLHALEMATTEYAFLLSDEDLINLDCITKIMGILKQQKPGLILGKYQMGNGGKMLSYQNIGLHKKGKEAVMQLPSQGNLRPMVVNCSIIDFQDLYQYQDVMYMQQFISYDACTKGDLIILDECLGIVSDDEAIKNLPLIELQKKYDIKDTIERKHLYFSPEARRFQFRETIILLKKRMSVVSEEIIEKIYEIYLVASVYGYQQAVCLEPGIINMHGYLPRLNPYDILEENLIESIKFFTDGFENSAQIIIILKRMTKIYKDNLDEMASKYKEFKEKIEIGNRLLLFGGSNGAKSTLYILQKIGYEITAFVDNAEKKWGTTFMDVPIISPEELSSTDVIWISSNTFLKEISSQLDGLGFKYYKFPLNVIANLEYLNGNII